MSDVTQILGQIENGDGQAAEKLLPLVYDELRRLAAQRLVKEKPGLTPQATSLVHEAYIRLVDVERAQHWNSRNHFFAAAAEAMRRILVERAREKQRPKHGGDLNRLEFDEACAIAGKRAAEVLAVNDALRDLAEESPTKPSWSSCGTSRGCRSKRLPTHWEYRVQLPSDIGLTPRPSCIVPCRTKNFQKTWHAVSHFGGETRTVL